MLAHANRRLHRRPPLRTHHPSPLNAHRQRLSRHFRPSTRINRNCRYSSRHRTRFLR
jgi:hypothetical protein